MFCLPQKQAVLGWIETLEHHCYPELGHYIKHHGFTCYSPFPILLLSRILECLKSRLILLWQGCASPIRQTRTRQCLHKQHSSWSCSFWQKSSLEVLASQSTTCKEKKKGNNKNIVATIWFSTFSMLRLKPKIGGEGTLVGTLPHFGIVWRIFLVLGCVSALGAFLLFPLEDILRLQALSCLQIVRVRVRGWTFFMHCNVKEIVPDIILLWIMGTEVSVLMEISSDSESRFCPVHWTPNTNKFSLLFPLRAVSELWKTGKGYWWSDLLLWILMRTWELGSSMPACVARVGGWWALYCQALSSSAGFQTIGFVGVLLQFSLEHS